MTSPRVPFTPAQSTPACGMLRPATTSPDVQGDRQMKASQYVARQPDANGFIDYSEVEHRTWHTLIERQLKVIEQRACQEYLDGLDKLALPLSLIHI